MPKITNPVIKSKIRQGILAGKNDSDVLRAAGFSESMIKHKDRKQIKALEVEKSRIAQEIKEADVTVLLVLNNLFEDRELARKKNDIATMKEVDNLLGKYLAMFTDKLQSDMTIKDQQERQARINRLKEFLNTN